MELPGTGAEDVASEEELDEAFAVFGLKPEGDLGLEDEFYLWPENLPAFNFWLAVQSQWIWHEGFRTGLNYAGVDARLKHWNSKKSQKQQLFETTCALEGECMRAWSETRK